MRLILIFVFSFLSFVSLCLSAPDVPKPNILFILADDLGVGNVSCYGADHYRTPIIDQLAAGGLRYSHAYTAPLCGPSRALILSGRYAFRTGATGQDSTGKLSPKVEKLMPVILKSAGYVSACVGKWGQLPLTPRDFGFDEFLQFKASGVYRNTELGKPEPYVVNGQKRVMLDSDYMPDLMHDFLADFITRHQEQPFLAYYSLSSVHGELLPTPDSAPNPEDLLADNIAYMDKLVGKILSKLESLHLRERTLVVFLGDNGTGKSTLLREIARQTYCEEGGVQTVDLLGGVADRDHRGERGGQRGLAYFQQIMDDFGLALLIERGQWLVQQHDARAHQQSAANRHPLAFAARQFGGRAVEQMSDIEQADNIVKSRAVLVRGRPFLPIDQIVLDGHMRKQPVILKHIADAALLRCQVDARGTVEQGRAIDADMACLRGQQACHDIGKAGFARPGRAEQGNRAAITRKLHIQHKSPQRQCHIDSDQRHGVTPDLVLCMRCASHSDSSKASIEMPMAITDNCNAAPSPPGTCVWL